MTLSEIYFLIMDPLKDVLILSGMVSLTISLIVMLVNMLIDAFSGKGFRIGLKW